jgi:hypothetical protein
MDEENFMPNGLNDRIDIIRVRYPHCIVWTPIPLITWLFPFIGHMGIARTDGVIRDFAGPYYVSVSLTKKFLLINNYLNRKIIWPLVDQRDIYNLILIVFQQHLVQTMFDLFGINLLNKHQMNIQNEW